MRILTTLCCLCGLAMLGGVAQAQDWQLVWSDEFDVDGPPDPTRWVYDTGGGGWGNNEWQFYTDRTDNVVVEDGILKIRALRENMGSHQYTSGRIATRGLASWLYGRFEIRAKVPVGRGTWSAIWMLPENGQYGNGSWPDNGEIDIMEHVGYDPLSVHSTVHTQVANTNIGNQAGNSIEDADIQTEFHTYVLEWSPRSIRMLIDGQVINENTNYSTDWRVWPFDQAMHLILNQAIGGNWGGIQGIDLNALPATFEVDYVRVYRDAEAQPTINVTSTNAGSTLAPGDTLRLAADIQDAASALSAVTFRQAEGILAQPLAPPYGIEVADLHRGCYEIYIDASDSEGWSTTEGPINVQVGTDCGQAPYLMRAWRPGETIQAEYYDLGGSGEAFADLTPANSGAGIRLGEAPDVAELIAGNWIITNTSAREWTEYTVSVPAAGSYRLMARVAASSASQLGIEVDGSPVAVLDYPSSGLSGIYRAYPSEAFDLTEGDHVIRLAYQAAGLNLDWLQLQFVSGVNVDEIPESAPDLELSLYPNPVVDRFNVKWNGIEAVANVWVTDVLGRRMAIDVETAVDGLAVQTKRQLAPGLYMLVVEFAGDRVASSPFIVGGF